MELIPVLELIPSDHLPSGETVDTPSEDPADRLRWWHESLRAAGLPALEPVEPGSCLVPIGQLHDAGTLIRLVRAIRRTGPRSAPRRKTVVTAIDRLLGGYVLRLDGQAVVEPGCCCDLGTLRDWEALITDRPADWSHPWVGHDGTLGEAVAVRYTGARFEVRTDETPGTVVVSETEFTRAIGEARVLVEDFTDRVQTAIAQANATLS